MQTRPCNATNRSGCMQSSATIACSLRAPTTIQLQARPARQCSKKRKICHVYAIAAPEPGTLEAEIGKAAGEAQRYQRSDFVSAFTSQLNEYNYWITEVEGQVPSSLRGTLFRNGPGRFERGKHKYAHVLDGDGYVCSFSFDDQGRVHFRSAYVKTSDLEKENEANAVLYRTIFGTKPSRRAGPLGAIQNALDLYVKNPANTNVVLWGDKLLALWEGGCPWAMDPYTLETHPGPDTLGKFLTSSSPSPFSSSNPPDSSAAKKPAGGDKLGGRGKGGGGQGKACTAHPHVVHGTGLSDRLATFSSEIKPRLSGLGVTIDIAEFDEQWQRVAGQSFTIDKTVFVPHDFAVSKHYYVFVHSATSFDLVQFLLGRQGPAQCLNMTDAPMSIHLVPRNGDKPLIIETEPCFLIHFANAYEEGDEVVLLTIGWGPDLVREAASKAGIGVFGSFSTGDYQLVPVTNLFSHRINVKTGQVTRQCLFAQRNDHPRVNPSFYSKPTRYVYVNTCTPEGDNVTNPPQAFARVDTQTGETQTWSPGIRCFCEELVFVPGPNAASQETDGHLLGLVYDAAQHRTFVAVLDAADFNKGPVAKLWLQHHMPHGLHGFFSPKYYGPT